MIRQDVVSLKLWMPCAKPERQFKQVALTEYQSSKVHHFHNLDKSIWSYQIVPDFTKIWQSFWLTQVKMRCDMKLHFDIILEFMSFLSFSFSKSNLQTPGCPTSDCISILWRFLFDRGQSHDGQRWLLLVHWSFWWCHHLFGVSCIKSGSNQIFYSLINVNLHF